MRGMVAPPSEPTRLHVCGINAVPFPRWAQLYTKLGRDIASCQVSTPNYQNKVFIQPHKFPPVTYPNFHPHNTKVSIAAYSMSGTNCGKAEGAAWKNCP